MSRQEETYEERRLAVVLLDLIGSTQFVERVGAHDAARLFQYHDRRARTLMHRFGGREIDRSDGFLLSFNRVIDAVNFALYYQMTIPPLTKLGARIGIHWGTVVEVKQRELDVMVGAKPVELEGLTKNIAARTMSLCRAGQVLLTRDAFALVRSRSDRMTPRDTRFACVGIYKMKGVRELQVIYAVGSDIKHLQPPQGNAKVIRVGGPKKIKSRARHRKLLEWVEWSIYRGALISLGYILTHMYPYLKYQLAPLIGRLMEIYEQLR